MKILKNIAISEAGFLFNSITGESFSVNPTGIEIINMLKEEKSIEDIKTNVLNIYQIDEATFEKDFYDFVEVLKQFSLIDTDGEKEN